jgi:hypothetical protein
MNVLAQKGLLDQAASMTWYANLGFGAALLLLGAVFFTGNRKAENSGNEDAGCSLLILAVLFGVAGFILVFRGLFGS